MLVGCDFSSSPSRRKPIVLALGRRDGARVQLLGLERIETLPALAQWLAQPQPWVGGFDLPFGLPRELVTTLGWPTDWRACMQHYRSLTREQIREAFAGFCDARPVGGKFAHRATDGLLAREVLQRRSYKSDDRAKQTPDRLIARKDLVNALELGQTRLGLRLKLSHAQRDALVQDASGDSLDAVLCLLQAAWAQQQHDQGDALYGLPPGLDALEGWIVTAPWGACGA